jgi:hypothetical protein
VLHVRGEDADADIGDRQYLVLARPDVIMSDVRLRGLGVAGSDAAGRRSPHNHAQTARNLRRSLRNAAAGARLVQVDGLDSESAADVTASLADAIEELHRLERSLDRRIRRDLGRRAGAVSEAPWRTPGVPNAESEKKSACRPRGSCIKHIKKELDDEIAHDPLDLGEWIDVIILGLDGAWRTGHGRSTRHAIPLDNSHQAGKDGWVASSGGFPSLRQ